MGGSTVFLTAIIIQAVHSSLIGSSVSVFFRHGEMPHEFATVSTRASVMLSHVSGPHRGNNARYIVSSHVREGAAHVPRMTWT